MNGRGFGHARERATQRRQIVDDSELELGCPIVGETQNHGRKALAARETGGQANTGFPQRELERIAARILQAGTPGHDQSR
jgi:hypothetical protein